MYNVIYMFTPMDEKNYNIGFCFIIYYYSRRNERSIVGKKCSVCNFSYNI